MQFILVSWITTCRCGTQSELSFPLWRHPIQVLRSGSLGTVSALRLPKLQQSIYMTSPQTHSFTASVTENVNTIIGGLMIDIILVIRLTPRGKPCIRWILPFDNPQIYSSGSFKWYYLTTTSLPLGHYTRIQVVHTELNVSSWYKKSIYPFSSTSPNTVYHTPQEIHYPDEDDEGMIWDDYTVCDAHDGEGKTA